MGGQDGAEGLDHAGGDGLGGEELEDPRPVLHGLERLRRGEHAGEDNEAAGDGPGGWMDG